jgi:hypothetical protein
MAYVIFRSPKGLKKAIGCSQLAAPPQSTAQSGGVDVQVMGGVCMTVMLEAVGPVYPRDVSPCHLVRLANHIPVAVRVSTACDRPVCSYQPAGT